MPQAWVSRAFQLHVAPQARRASREPPWVRVLTATSRGVGDAGLTESLDLLIARFADDVLPPPQRRRT